MTGVGEDKYETCYTSADGFEPIDPIIANRVEPESDARFARGLQTHSGGLSDHEVLYVLAWISSFAAQGVIGNLTYDLVRSAAARRWRGRPSPPEDEKLPDYIYRRTDAESMAKHLVQTRCEQLGWRVPSWQSMKVTQRKFTWDEMAWNMIVIAPGLEAEVVLAKGYVSYQSFPVTLHTTVDP